VRCAWCFRALLFAAVYNPSPSAFIITKTQATRDIGINAYLARTVRPHPVSMPLVFAVAVPWFHKMLLIKNG
jgi:hypothetical protein